MLAGSATTRADGAQRSPGTPVAVSPLLLEAVEAALRAARITDGDVDPTIGEALIAQGYDRDFDGSMAAEE